MMRPRPAVVIDDCAARDMRKALRRCTSITESQSDVVIRKRAVSRRIPGFRWRVGPRRTRRVVFYSEADIERAQAALARLDGSC